MKSSEYRATATRWICLSVDEALCQGRDKINDHCATTSLATRCWQLSGQLIPDLPQRERINCDADKSSSVVRRGGDAVTDELVRGDGEPTDAWYSLEILTSGWVSPWPEARKRHGGPTNLYGHKHSSHVNEAANYYKTKQGISQVQQGQGLCLGFQGQGQGQRRGLTSLAGAVTFKWKLMILLINFTIDWVCPSLSVISGHENYYQVVYCFLWKITV